MARPVTRSDRSAWDRLGWLPWVLLVAAVVAAVVLLAPDGRDEDAAPSAEQVPSAPQPETTPGERGDAVAGTEGDDAASAERQLEDPPQTDSLTTEDGRALLPLPEGDDLSTFADARVQARSLTVQSVVADGLIWVGQDEDDRVLVRLDGGADVEAGTLVTFTGTVVPLDDDTRQAVGDDDGAELLERQGHYVRAEDVETS